jgi:hypothetical protein
LVDQADCARIGSVFQVPARLIILPGGKLGSQDGYVLGGIDADSDSIPTYADDRQDDVVIYDYLFAELSAEH